MKRKSPKGANPPPFPARTLLTVAALAAAAAVAFLALSGGGPTHGAGADGEILDVHGLAVHPDRPDEVYVATHRGLFRSAGDGWERVGETRDDLMGFSMHPTDGSVFWSSGHPENPSRDHYNLGVRVSRDGGHTWERIALEGVDFHAMAVSPADPDRLWGVFGGKLHRSTDGGYGWDVVSASPPPAFALAPHPTDADTVFASTGDGIARSLDGGATWQPLSGIPAIALAIHPQDPDTLYASTREGLHRSVDGGATWAPVPLDAGGGTVTHLAISSKDPRVVYAATLETGIYKSADGGETWRVLKEPTPALHGA